MMTDVIRQFQSKADEINIYFDHLDDLILKKAKLEFNDGTTKRIGLELSHILRANAFLLLYNLIESSISQAIEQIHLEIITQGIDYNRIDRRIKKEIIRYIKKDISVDDFLTEVNDIVIDIVKLYPASRKLFSGNVDAREIKDVAERYGFSYATNSTKTRNGASLFIIKNKRNDLAHGFISFQDCGKDYTIQEMFAFKDEVLFYVEEILMHIDQFILSRSYIV